MGGFLPLIEAFLAFALTMTALTIAVSALVGTWHKLTRTHAYALRMLMVYFLRNEILPLIPDGASGDLRTLRSATPEDEDARTNALAKFLVDMTMLPMVVDYRRDVPEADRAKIPDARVATLRNGLVRSRWLETRADGGAGAPWDRQSWADGFYRWRSLRFALDALPIDEFRSRLAASDIGKALSPATIETLARRFATLNHASAESVQRSAHVVSFVAGFVLAFAANIDSLNLLSSYMSRPELARQVIAAYERGNAIEVKSADRDAAAALLPNVRALSEAKAGVVAAIESSAFKQLDAELQQKLRAQLGAIDAAAKEVREAAVDAAVLVAGVAQSFPVGWNLYPNCAPPLRDPRCLQVLRAAAATPASDGWLQVLGTTSSHDRGGFVRWLIGVLLTGFLLGLGAPFWMQAVSGMLAARNLIRGRNSSGDGPPPNAGAGATERRE
jgi:hypothetical protein